MRHEPLQLGRRLHPSTWLSLSTFSGTTLDLSTEPRDSSSVADCLTTVSYGRTSSMEGQRMSWQREMKKD
jgi:hypothetical protein